MSAPVVARPELAIAFLVFDPPAELAERVDALRGVAGTVIVIDDGTAPTEASTRLFDAMRAMDNVTVVEKGVNLGIANSVNLGLHHARRAESERLLTFDQDTVTSPELVVALSESADRLDEQRADHWGVVGPGGVGGIRYEGGPDSGLIETTEIIQSAALFSLDALVAVGGARDEMVIDVVDTDLCLRLRRRGYGVFVDQAVAIDHAIGTGELITIFGRTALLTGHSPIRRYYIVRNRIRLLCLYGSSERDWASLTWRRLLIGIALSVTIEPNRVAKAKATLVGALHGFRHRDGPYKRATIESTGTTVAAVVVLDSGRDCLEEQLISIVQQSHPVDLIVLVDDCSDDGSLLFAEELLGRISSARVLSLPRLRTSSSTPSTRIASNFLLGMHAARAPTYIALSDRGHVWLPNRVADQIDSLVSTGASVTTGSTLQIGPRDAKLRYLLRKPIPTGGPMMVTGAFAASIDRIPPGWLHDRWISLVAASRGELAAPRAREWNVLP